MAQAETVKAWKVLHCHLDFVQVKKRLHYLTNATPGEHFSCHTTHTPNTNHSHCKCPDFLLKQEVDYIFF